MSSASNRDLDNGPGFTPEALQRLFSPLSRFSRLALAVSGGSDSMALLHLAAGWRDLNAQPPEIAVLTVDHGLRPESAAEAEAVAEAAQQFGFAHLTLVWREAKPRTGLQAAAREARYRLMTGWCREHGADALVTAHTQDDQAETFLLRLARGSGVDGLSAMSPEVQLDGCVLCRPLLGLSRARLRAYLRERGLAWFDDPSNKNPAFERVRIRRALSRLRGSGVTPAAISLSARRLKRASRALDELTDQLFSSRVCLRPEGYLTLPRQVLTEVPEESRIRLLARMLDVVGGEAQSPRLARIERLAGDVTRTEFAPRTLGGCLIEVSGNELRVFREFGRMRDEPLVLAPGEEKLWDGRFAVRLGPEAAGPVTVQALGPEGWREVRKSREDAMGAEQPIPRLAAFTMPAAWDGDRLLAAPLISWMAPDAGPAAHLTAAFAPRPIRAK